MKLLSIIIPIYNVEQYIDKCLLSLENQDISKEDYEIICVNDGSTDGSREAVLHLQEQYSNISLIDHPENQGVSMARNTGYDAATGKYLLLIDPDDFVEENSLGYLIMKADNCKAQLTFPGYAYLDPDCKVKGKKIFKSYGEKVFTGIEAYHILRGRGEKLSEPLDGIIVDSVSGVLFEADFINKNRLRYVRGMKLFADCEFLARAHCLAERCIVVNHMLYMVFPRNNSASRSNQFGKKIVREGFIRAASNLDEFRQNISLNEQQVLFLNGPVVQFVLHAVYSAIQNRSLNQYKILVNDLKKAGLGKLKLKGCEGYLKICGLSYNLSPYLGALVLATVRRIDYWNNKFIKHRIY